MNNNVVHSQIYSLLLHNNIVQGRINLKKVHNNIVQEGVHIFLEREKPGFEKAEMLCYNNDSTE
jgi:hypothetical protein